MWDVIDGVVSDNPIEKLPYVYDWAKIKIMIFNHRKLFGLSYEQAINEPFEEIILNDRINKLISDKVRLENKKRG